MSNFSYKQVPLAKPISSDLPRMGRRVDKAPKHKPIGDKLKIPVRTF